MALASEDEWESDPELKQMRKEFVESFAGRRQAIEAVLPALRGSPSGTGAPFDAALKEVARIAHKLAGAAETYGFPSLSRAGAAFEEWHDRAVESGKAADAGLAVAGAELLVRLLSRCQALGKDSPEHLKEAELAALEKAASGG